MITDEKEVLQALFDRSVEAVLKQGEQSADEGGNCVYRGGNGLKCAVGHLISDEYYTSTIEGFALGELDDRGRFLRNIISETQKDLKLEVDDLESPPWLLLKDLQIAHDTSENSETFKQDFLTKANRVVKKFDLKPWKEV